jgi:anti-sigma factor RsiW
MNTPQCDNLDAYLCGWLSPQETAAFEAHLADCAACRREAEQQRRIDQLLEQGAGRVEAIPSSLIDAIEGRITRLGRRRKMRWALGLSTAVAAMLAIGVWLARQRGDVRPGPRPIAEKPTEKEPTKQKVAPPVQEASASEPRVRVALADPSDGIAVPLETSNPRVSIVWIYPAVKPVQAVSRPATRSP